MFFEVSEYRWRCRRWSHFVRYLRRATAARRLAASVLRAESGAERRERFFSNPRREEGANRDSQPTSNEEVEKKIRGLFFFPRGGKILKTVHSSFCGELGAQDTRGFVAHALACDRFAMQSNEMLTS